ncbi:MAG: biotin--[acetyl-CoA-carboxylase] ligase [Chloroflexi bacterium]|nr:biotin--[acetyl-CoA-carboxylase] ligase [Chloroflexota bacterium]
MKAHRFYRYESLGSTNDEARRLAALGEPEGAVVVAEAQTAGRGRAGRVWVTPPGGAVAMSLILRPRVAPAHLTQMAMLGGLAVAEGIRAMCGVAAELKWPNDVLVAGRKVAGVLAEASFAGEQLDWVVLGMGVNVNAGPPPAVALDASRAATCLAAEVGYLLERESVMSAILSAFDARYAQLGTPALAAAWVGLLAMRGKRVEARGPAETVTGRLEGVTAEGAAVLRLASGESRVILAGDVHLREG